MRIVRFDSDRLGVLTGDRIADVTDDLGLASADPLKEFLSNGGSAEDIPDGDPNHDVDYVRLEPPVERPGKVVAAPLNYESHVEEMGMEMNIKERGYFLKAPSSVVGPDDEIMLPFTDRRIDYELELGFVVGDRMKDVSGEAAWDGIFGYVIALDISMRGEQDRSNRKSYDTFTAIGPWIATQKEVGDPQALQMTLRLNGERRQYANTEEMIYTCGDIVEYASTATTLEPGDIVVTGTPSGVGQLSDGDLIKAEIENIGEMIISVQQREETYE
jgi:2-keto-4-pentenoate hydratase/2-oxohepta-3-ene-1,7-dioic acid hydratase in catechol pathway